MKRILRLLLMFFRANLLEIFAYRASFVAGVFSTLLWIALSLVGISIVTYQSPIVGGWSRYELFLVQGIYSLILGIMYFTFRANFGDVSRLIRRGDLDFLLVKPCDSQFLVSVGKFIVYQLSRIVTGVVLIFYSLRSLGIVPTITDLVIFIPLLFCSLVVIYSLWFFITTLSIWLVDLFNLDELFIQITGVTRYPLEMLRYISEFLLYVTMPLVVITTVPSQVLLSKLNPTLAIWSVAIATTLFIATRKFWKFALRFYTSASS